MNTFGKKLIIFDFDGVIVDSEVIANQIDAEELTKAGYETTVENCIQKFTGLSYNSMSESIFYESGIRLNEEFWLDTRKKRIKALADNLKPILGIDAVLREMKGDQQPYCIASSSDLSRIKHSLSMVGLENHFSNEIIFSSSMVKRGKPHPDLFLHTASTLNMHPRDCIVIEDSVAGIQAAKASGMRVIGLLAAKHTEYPWYIKSIEHEQPDEIVYSSSGLLKLFN